MKLEYTFTKGHGRSLLSDAREEKLYFIPKEIEQIDELLEPELGELTSLIAETESEIHFPGHIEVLEVEEDFKDTRLALRIARDCLADFLIVHLKTTEEYNKLITDIIEEKSCGNLTLRRVHLIVPEDIFLDLSPITDSIFNVITDKLLLKRREIRLENFNIREGSHKSGEQYNLFFNLRMKVSGQHHNLIENVWKIDTEVFEKLNTINQLLHYDKHWKIGKSKIVVCRDCEFRNICIDALPPVKIDTELFQRSEECPYNPYTCTWQTDESYINISDCVSEGIVTEEYIFRQA